MMVRYSRVAIVSMTFIGAVACGSSATAPATPKTVVRPIQIESVEVVLSPPSAHVRGVIGDGCTELGSVHTQRSENTVSITIFSQRPEEAICIQIAKLYDAILALPGDFPPGQYVLRVNGVEKAFSVR